MTVVWHREAARERAKTSVGLFASVYAICQENGLDAFWKLNLTIL
jgi:hypothetical protein